MPWNDSDELLVGGTGQVYVAAVGSTEPTNESSVLSAATWKGLGYHTEDGVSVANAPEITRFMAWQSKRPVRIDRQADTFTISFQLLQWDEDSTPLAFGGGSITDLGSGHYKFSPPSETSALDERALVCDVQDGSDVLRFVIPRGVAVEGVDSQFNRSNMSSLGVTFEALENDNGDDWYFLTNLAGFATGS